jgi:hypothetical protein
VLHEREANNYSMEDLAAMPSEVSDEGVKEGGGEGGDGMK